MIILIKLGPNEKKWQKGRKKEKEVESVGKQQLNKKKERKESGNIK